MNKIIFTMLVIGFSLSLSASEKQGLESLSPGLRTLLSTEMIEIRKGMGEIFVNIIYGKYTDVSKIATKIENSFILKKKLTKSQKKELHTKLPKEFLVTDGSLHHDAGALADAADLEDVALMNFYYSKMTNTCVKCHSKFAKSRFPDFGM